MFVLFVRVCVHTECKDIHEQCAKWSAKGECVRNYQFMVIECQKSCKMCGDERHFDTTRRLSTATTTVDISSINTIHPKFHKHHTSHTILLKKKQTNSFPKNMQGRPTLLRQLCGHWQM